MIKNIFLAAFVIACASCTSLKDAGYNVEGEVCVDGVGCVSVDGDKNVKVRIESQEWGNDKVKVRIDPAK